MDVELNRRLLGIFEAEFGRNLETIRATLARAERVGTLPAADLQEIFRLTHSLKGAARVVGLDRIDDVTHQLESLFSEMLSGRRTFAPEMSPRIHAVLDYLEDWFSAWKQGSSAPDDTGLRSELAA